MDHEEQGEIVEKRGQKGGRGYFEIAHADHVGHDEGGGSHDGRHDLSTGGCNGFHGAGEGRLISDAFHEGDGEGAGAVDVGWRRTGNGAEKRTGEDGHFCWTALGSFRKQAGEIHEDGAHARALKEGAEHDEGEDHA